MARRRELDPLAEHLIVRRQLLATTRCNARVATVATRLVDKKFKVTSYIAASVSAASSVSCSAK